MEYAEIRIEEEKAGKTMKEEEKSMFDGFETDETTGEVIIPRASVGVVPDETANTVKAEENLSSGGEYIPVNSEEDELPVLQFDFNFGEEEFANPEEGSDEDPILQSIDDALAVQMAASLGTVEEVNKKESKKKKGLWSRIPLWSRITVISLCSLCIALGLLVGTKPGRSLIYGWVAGYIGDGVTRPEELTPAPTGSVDNPKPTGEANNNENNNNNTDVTPVPGVEPRHEDYCYNILLVGVEALPQFGGERSDSMLLLSVNSRDKKIHMTSLMRDMYVQIPGEQNNKLNAAFAHGGAELLIDTIELNLQVKIDGYVQVGFDSFEWIVDRLGGVEITLTSQEADYLRRTNYISNPANRNVVAGTQIMNGNQVLGYCRVRYVPTANGTHSDFGRTERQRSVLTKLFNKYKESNIFTLLSILNDCLPRVITDISKTDIQNLLETVVENRILSLDTMRIPVSGTYEDASIGGGVGDVIIVRWAKNIDALHEYIFGPEE